MTTGRPPRIAIFTHDTYGLGHVRRSLRFMRALSEQCPGVASLLVTGSPALGVFKDLPPGADVVKIPTLVRTGSEDHRPPHLQLPIEEVTHLRSEIIRRAVLGFDPDVFLVDNFPLGSRRELLPVLTDLKDRPTRTVVGLRDILDAPEVVRSDWTQLGIYTVLEELYDRILIYGAPEVLDQIEAYAFPASTVDKVRYCGYVTDPRATPEATRNALPEGLEEPFLLVTGGGGGDGYPLLRTFIAALDLMPPTPALVLTGPLMSARDRQALQERVAGRPGAQVHEFIPEAHRLLSRAEVVVSMCGYNTAAEILAQGARAVVVPRTWKYGEHEKGDAAGVEWEQVLRARAFAALGWVRMVEPGQLTPASLAGHIEACRLGRVNPPGSMDLDGMALVARNLLQLARSRGETHGAA